MRCCPECQSPLAAAPEVHRYVESGLPSVELECVTVRRCPCGHRELVLPRIEALHRGIAGAVIAKPARLAGVEVRYLRSVLDLSGRALARRMGVDPSTLSNWETGKEPIGGSSDRLLRLMVALSLEVDYDAEQLERIGPALAPPIELRARATSRGWRVSRAEA